jgi:hypothetical protein
MRKYRNYTREDVEKYAKEVYSMADLLRKLGLAESGGSYGHMKQKMSQWKIDCSHWTGSSWNKNKQTKDWSTYSKFESIKKLIMLERPHKCEGCGLETWMNEKIPLELDHINGDRTNNSKENLRLLCCNCHALTPTWRGRNNNSNVDAKNLPRCLMCNNTVKKPDRKCCSRKCSNSFLSQNPFVDTLPSNEEIGKLVKKHGITKTAKMFNVSHSTILRRINFL